LLKVGSLIGIDRLCESSPNEGYRMVLVVALSITKDGESWKLNFVHCLPSAFRIHFAVAIDEATEISTVLI